MIRYFFFHSKRSETVLGTPRKLSRNFDLKCGSLQQIKQPNPYHVECENMCSEKKTTVTYLTCDSSLTWKKKQLFRLFYVNPAQSICKNKILSKFSRFFVMLGSHLLC